MAKDDEFSSLAEWLDEVGAERLKTYLLTKVRKRRPSAPRARLLYDLAQAIKLVEHARATIDSYGGLPKDESVKEALQRLDSKITILLDFASKVSGVELQGW